MTPAFRLYRTLMWLVSPFLGSVLRARARQGKEDVLRTHERFARRFPPRLPGQLVWLHGASVGESLILLELGRRLIAARPGLMLVFTSQTLTSARLMGQILPDNAIHLMAPIDTPGAARRFLQHWRPDLCIFAEGEIWPNLVHEARRADARLALVNARMTEKSARGWLRFKGLFHALAGRFDVVLAADDDTARRLETLLGRAIRVSGNLKSALLPPEANPADLQRLKTEFIKDRRCLLAASTHPGEEALFLDAVAASHDTALIIAPRHPARGAEIEAMIRERRLSVARRSRGEAATARDRVLLADTMGEMGLWYRLADAVYLGGGHADGVGGHNPLEPVRLGKPVVTGPHVHNFAAMMSDLEQRGLIRTAPDATGVATALSSLPPPDGAALAGLAAEADRPMDITLAALLAILPVTERWG